MGIISFRLQVAQILSDADYCIPPSTPEAFRHCRTHGDVVDVALQASNIFTGEIIDSPLLFSLLAEGVSK